MYCRETCLSQKKGILFVVGRVCCPSQEKGHFVCVVGRVVYHKGRGILFVVGRGMLSITGEGAYCLVWEKTHVGSHGIRKQIG